MICSLSASASTAQSTPTALQHFCRHRPDVGTWSATNHSLCLTAAVDKGSNAYVILDMKQQDRSCWLESETPWCVGTLHDLAAHLYVDELYWPWIAGQHAVKRDCRIGYMEMYCICTPHQLCPGRSSVKQLHHIQHVLVYLLCSRSHVTYAFTYHLLVELLLLFHMSCILCH